MSYQYGATKKQAEPLEEIEAADVRTRDQIARDIERTRRQTKGLETRITTAQADHARLREQLADERRKIEDARNLVKQARRDAQAELEAAQRQSIIILSAAEKEAAHIRETAYMQARAIHDSAHADGIKRGREYAIARNSALRRIHS